MTNSPSYIDARLNNRATVRLQLERRRNTHAFDTTDPTTRKGDTTTTTTSTSTTTKTTATMVYYFKSRCGDFLIYMGKDKYENEDLIKYGLPEDVWFHVDDLSSAHVYLRMKPGMTMDDISEDLLLDCSALVKANSIQGCKVRISFLEKRRGEYGNFWPCQFLFPFFSFILFCFYHYCFFIFILFF